jgi:hypothetical protein
MTAKLHHYRKVTWALIAWSAVMILWFVVSAAPIATASCSGNILDDSPSAMDSYFGSGHISASSAACVKIDVDGGRFNALLDQLLGHGLIWALGFGVLGGIWYATRERTRDAARVA